MNRTRTYASILLLHVHSCSAPNVLYISASPPNPPLRLSGFLPRMLRSGGGEEVLRRQGGGGGPPPPPGAAPPPPPDPPPPPPGRPLGVLSWRSGRGGGGGGGGFLTPRPQRRA